MSSEIFLAIPETLPPTLPRSLKFGLPCIFSLALHVSLLGLLLLFSLSGGAGGQGGTGGQGDAGQGAGQFDVYVVDLLSPGFAGNSPTPAVGNAAGPAKRLEAGAASENQLEDRALTEPSESRLPASDLLQEAVKKQLPEEQVSSLPEQEATALPLPAKKTASRILPMPASNAAPRSVPDSAPGSVKSLRALGANSGGQSDSHDALRDKAATLGDHVAVTRDSTGASRDGSGSQGDHAAAFGDSAGTLGEGSGILGDSSGGLGGNADGGTGLVEDFDHKPRIVHRVKVEYPEDARKKRIIGHVLLRFRLDETGLLSQLEVSRAVPPGVFEQAALEAVKQWRFAPALKNGRPVACRVELPIPFVLR